MIPKIRMDQNQEIEPTINEEAFLFAQYLRNENRPGFSEWRPLIEKTFKQKLHNVLRKRNQMIVTYSKPYGIVRGMLKKWKKVGVVSCNSCARACETGGKERMEELANRLKQDGFEVVDTELLPMACNIEAAKKPEYQADYLVVLACDSGVCTLQTLFPNIVVVPALDTVGIGARDMQGDIFLMKKF